MEIIRAKRAEAIVKYRRHETDSGSPEVQIAVLTGRILHLTEHMRKFKHDYSTQRGLMKMVGRRSALLKYLRRTDPPRYQKIISDLSLRK